MQGSETSRGKYARGGNKGGEIRLKKCKMRKSNQLKIKQNRTEQKADKQVEQTEQAPHTTKKMCC